MEIDLTTLTKEELDVLQADVMGEQARRQILVEAEARVQEVEQRAVKEMASIAQNFLAARDGGGGSDWVAPQGSHDAYPKGWTVVVDGQEWESLIDGNVWQPGESGWRMVTQDGSPAPWVQPTGAHDAYAMGDTVSHAGKTWESTHEANVWEPPTMWNDITSAPDTGESDVPVEPTVPVEPPPAPAVPAWKQPTGAHDAYNIGDRVTFGGKTYESVIGANTWSPTAYPAGWKVI